MTITIATNPDITPCTEKLACFPTIQAAYSDLLGYSSHDDNYFSSGEEERGQYKFEHCCTNHPLPLVKRFYTSDSTEGFKFRVQQSSGNGFVSAAHMAFESHYPLVLKPDHVWLCIIQAFAIHIKMNKNKYTEELFKGGSKHDFDQKTKLDIRRDDFIRGEPNNWEEVFEGFSEQIRTHVGESTHSMIVSDFSTTSKVDRMASELVLMDLLEPYFDLNLTTLCGIPHINIEGTREDWQKIRNRIENFTQFGLDWWLEVLCPVVDQFVAAFDGPVDGPKLEFWKSFYKLSDMSGGPYVTGWINTFFPYISSTGTSGVYGYDVAEEYDDELEINSEDFPQVFAAPLVIPDPPLLSESPAVADRTENETETNTTESQKEGEEEAKGVLNEDDEYKLEFKYVINEACTKWQVLKHGPTTGSYCSGVSTVSFTWNYFLTQYPMQVVSGFVGYCQDPDTLAIWPAVGYVIADQLAPPDQVN